MAQRGATGVKTAELFDVRGLGVIVTGGARGIGLAYAEALADNGASVVLLDRDGAEAGIAAAALTARSGSQVTAVTANVMDRPGLSAAIDEAVARLGRLDVMFANAGIEAGPGFLSTSGEREPEGAIEAIGDDLWDRVMAVNLTGVFAAVQAAARHMKTQRSGRIILTASIAGLRLGSVVGTPYQISKAGVAHLAKQAALELARYGILVNAIVPGPFQTDLTTPALRERFEAGSPSSRIGDVGEIQGAALFLASPASSYVTGTHLVIDGGASLGRAD